MDQKKAVIAVVVVAISVLGIILGSIFYLRSVFNANKTSGSRVVTSSQAPASTSASNQPETSVQDGQTTTLQTPPTGSAATSSDFKTYSGTGFHIQYPKNWGLLTCSNSQNFELDPNNSLDSLGSRCDFALKPVTFLIGKASCTSGTLVKLGNINVLRSIQNTPTGIDYHWCTKTAPALDITHRVSTDGSRASSISDFSPQVEQIIKSFQGS